MQHERPIADDTRRPAGPDGSTPDGDHRDRSQRADRASDDSPTTPVNEAERRYGTDENPG